MRASVLIVAVAAVQVWSAALHATIIETDGSVIVESRSGGKNVLDYMDVAGGSSNTWYDASTSAKSTAPGTTRLIGSRYNSNAYIGKTATYFQVSPTLPANPGGQWSVYVTVCGANPGNVTSTISGTGFTGLPATTTAFSSAGANTWVLVGSLTLSPGVSKPSITFDETSSTGRFYADAVKFVPVTPEPTSLLLAGSGLIGLLIRRR